MSHDLTSIITPSFNRADYIEGAIKSVQEQTSKRIEYIVIDGASHDGTIAILEKYRDIGLLTYLSEPDKGMYDAINKGLSLCHGEIIAYLNTDDMYFPWTIATVNAFFTAHADIDVAYGDTLVMDMKTGRQQLNVYPEFSSTWLRAGAIIAQPTVFLRRRIVEKVGMVGKDVRLLGDCEYWLRCLDKGARFGKVHEFLAIECNHGGTLRETKAAEVVQEKQYLIEKYGQGIPVFLARMLLRLKYLEKEWLILQLIRRIKNKKLSHKWWNFIDAYISEVNVRNHLKNKIFRTKELVWEVRAKDGSSLII